jgi:hypothetical protein
VPDGQAPAVEGRILQRLRSRDSVGQRDTEWLEDMHFARMNGRLRTSWIISPADGRLPYSAEGRRRVTARATSDDTNFDDPERRTVLERCLLGAAGPPIANLPAAANIQIVQTAAEVVILSEVNHDARIIRLGGRHPPPSVRPWMGDSIGRWEGQTLVVETTNLHPGGVYRLGFLLSGGAKVVERFTRVSPTQIRYEFSVDDPELYSQVWHGEMPLVRSQAPTYEYACHEGNYALPGILAGARHEEAARR